MSKIQAQRTNRKKYNNTGKPIKSSLQEIVLMFFYFIGLYLFISLFTYYGGDPGWGRSGSAEEIQNIGGMVGAVFADIFLNLFGYFAYLFPIMVGYMGWLIYKGRHHEIFSEPKNLLIPSIGFLTTLMAGCGLAIVHFTSENTLLPTHAGGILGQWVGNSLVAMVNPLGATLILLALFFTGITLLTALSWMRLADVVGYYTLIWLPVIKDYMSTQFLPWLSINTKKTLKTTTKISKIAGTNTKKWSKTAYNRWQKRRIEWREERKQYAEESMYDDEYEEYDEYEDEIEDKKYVEKPLHSLVKKPTIPLPSLKLLDAAPNVTNPPTIKILSQRMTDAFANIGIDAEIISVQPGPVLTTYEVNPITPINTNHLDDLDIALAESLKIVKVKTIENQGETLHIEIPTWKRQPINLCELLNSSEYQSNLSPLAIALGRDIGGQPVIIDLTRIPHILIAGSNNTEKNTAINTFILSLLYKSSPEAVRLLLVDNATNDLAIYTDLPHLLAPIVTDVQQIPNILTWCEQEMEHRYKLMASIGVRGIDDYNQAQLLQAEVENINEPLPHIMMIINELSELMVTGVETKIEQSITSLTRKARAVGIHIILATQYPTVNVITGLIKNNVPTRIAFKVDNKNESRTILGQVGAEELLEQGDMLYMTAGTGTPVRVHGSSVSKSEVENVVADLKSRSTPVYVDFTDVLVKEDS
ncbi:MAG: DNA translocase FtsK 4TM domain-containing protein [Candidatus Marithrix sp.]